MKEAYKSILHKKRCWLYMTLIVMLLVMCSSAVLAATPYASHGKLAIKSGKVVDKSGKVFTIKGVSTHGLSWYPEYVNKAAFKDLRDKWGVNTIRLAMYTAEYNGYCVAGSQNQKKLKALVDNGVQAATDLGMYVIIDWHILSDGNPLTYKSQANAFFKETAKKYAGYSNVMYEICNEPNGGGSWSNIRSYAGTIIKTIRSVNKNAIIIVGTPTWSQDVDVASAKPITGYTNIAYAFHFYADTHQGWMRDKLEAVLKKKLPVIVTEFGITDASGNGNVNTSQGNAWIRLLDKYSVGRVCWNLSNKNESSALIKSTSTKKSGWKDANLTAQGKWLVKTYTGKTLDQKTVTSTQRPTVAVTPKPTPTPIPKPDASTSSNLRPVSTGTVRVQAILRKTNSWKSNGKYYSQFTMTLKNVGKKDCKNWTSRVQFSRKAVFSGNWSANYSTSGAYITMKPLSWNKSIEKGKSIEFGFILVSDQAQSIKNITITAM